MKSTNNYKIKADSIFKPTSCLKPEQNGDTLSRVNFIVQETACPEPRNNSTWHLLQLSSSKCVASRDRIQGRDLCPQGVYHLWGRKMTTQLSCPGNFPTSSLTACSVLTVHQLHGPSALPDNAHVSYTGPWHVTSGSHRFTPHFLLVSFQMSHYFPRDPITLFPPVLLFFFLLNI